MVFNCDDLKRKLIAKNDEYRRVQRRNMHDAWNYYLGDSGDGKSLLEWEMAYIWACNPGDLPKELEKDTTLVILVGETFEPLLQSIFTHRPTRLIPIINTWYGDSQDPNSAEDHWRSFYRLIRDLPPSVTKRITNLEQIEMVDSVADDPSDVFSYLQSKLAGDLRSSKKTVIVDITGAKKTMVAGAFTLAAYTKAEIFYIDPELEDEYGQPCGFSARFRRLEGPLEKLAVHVWRQIEERYCRYDFSGALQLLGEALPEDTALRDREVEKLKLFFQICRDWEAGQLWTAHQLAVQLIEKMPASAELIPTVVEMLWFYWPDPKNEKAKFASSFFLDSEAMILHGEDELKRAERLFANGRFRSAFTRSFALLETLLKARAALLHDKKQYLCEEVVRGSADQKEEAEKQEACYPIDLYSPEYDELYRKWLLWLIKLSANDLSQLLREPQKGNLQKTRLQKWNGRYFRVWWNYQGEPDYLDDRLYLYSAVNNEVPYIRNLVVHSYYPVNDPTIVDKCLTLAQRSLDNFKAAWTAQDQSESSTESRFEPPGWGEIKDAFKLSFLPEQNQPS